MNKLAELHANAPAFSRPETENYDPASGLLKREYFAAAALQGFIYGRYVNPKEAAEYAVKYADALLEALYHETPSNNK